MSVSQVQRAVSSAEFAEWIAFWNLEAELSGAADEAPPTPDQLGEKLKAWAAEHNARLAAKPPGRTVAEPVSR